jgi:hypothetical protein
MGGEITWTCVGQDSFMIKLVVYTDCNGMSLGTSPITFKCATSGATITTLNIAVGSPVDITPVCRTSCSRCQSSGCSFPYGIRKYTMQNLVILNGAGSCCSINISWSQTSRNSAITTITGAGSDDLYLEALLNRCQNPCDNSPSFTNSPFAILCVGQDFTLNFGTQDIDVNNAGDLLDSLIYEWTPPLKAAGSPCTYVGQYNYNKAIYFWGFPNESLPWPRGMQLDPQTSEIHFRPMKAEVTVMAVKVKEFRHGVKIAEIRRDMEISVITCSGNNPPSISTPSNIRSKSVSFGDTVRFDFTTTDPNTNDTVTINWNNAIKNAVWTDSNGLSKHPSASFVWVPNASDFTGGNQRTFYVIARDNACPINSTFTQAFTVNVVCKNNHDPTLSVNNSKNLYCMGDSIIYEFTTNDIDSIDTVRISYHGSIPGAIWTSTDGQAKHPTAKFAFVPPSYDTNNNKNFTFEVRYSDHACPYALTYTQGINFSVRPVILGNLFTLDKGCGNYIFGMYPLNYSRTYVFTLNLQGHTIIDTNHIYNYKFNNPGIYPFNLTINESHSCTRIINDAVVTDTFFGVRLPADTLICTGNAIKIVPQVFQNEPQVKYKWNYGADTSHILQTKAINLNSLIILTITNSAGCTSTDSMLIRVGTANFIALTLPPDTTLCIGNELNILPRVTKNIGPVKYNWSTGDTANILKLKHINVSTSVTLSVQDSTGCKANDNMQITIDNNGLLKLLLPADTNICMGTSSDIIPKVLQSKGIIKFRWSTGDTLNHLKTAPVYSNTLIYLWVQDSTGCMSDDKIQLSVLQNPTVMPSGNFVICYDSNITIKPSYSCYGSQNVVKSLKWLMADDTTAISTQNSLYIKDSGIYVFQVTDTYGCIGTDTIKVKMSTRVDSSLQVNGSKLILVPGMKLYTWYRNDTFDFNTLFNSYDISNKGSYYAILTNYDDCIAKTRSVYIDPSGIADRHFSGEFVIYPNPTSGKLILEANKPFSADITLSLINLYGREILHKTIKAIDLQTTKEIDISDQPAGTYTVIICYQNENFHQLIIKE